MSHMIDFLSDLFGSPRSTAVLLASVSCLGLVGACATSSDEAPHSVYETLSQDRTRLAALRDDLLAGRDIADRTGFWMRGTPDADHILAKLKEDGVPPERSFDAYVLFRSLAGEEAFVRFAYDDCVHSPCSNPAERMSAIDANAYLASLSTGDVIAERIVAGDVDINVRGAVQLRAMILANRSEEADRFCLRLLEAPSSTAERMVAELEQVPPPFTRVERAICEILPTGVILETN